MQRIKFEGREWLTDSRLNEGIRKEKSDKIEGPNGVEFSVLMLGAQQHRA